MKKIETSSTPSPTAALAAGGATRWRLTQVRELMLDVSGVLEGYDPERRRTRTGWGQVADVAYVVERLGEAVRHLGVFTTEAEMRDALGLGA